MKTRETHETRESRSAFRRAMQGGALLLPVLVCAICPVCLPAALGVLSALGLVVGEGVHHGLLGASLLLALFTTAAMTRRHGNPVPLWLTIVGAASIAAGCVLFEVPALEYLGIALVAVSSVWSWRLRRHTRPVLFRIRPAPKSS